MLEVSAGHERLLAGSKDHALDAFILSQNRRRFFHIGNKGVRYHVHGFVGIVEDQGGEAVIRLFDFKRSEEHTSELQSLMRISYAVFCLKKKNKQHSTSVCRIKTTHTKTHAKH